MSFLDLCGLDGVHAIVQTHQDDTNHSGETGEDDHDRPPDEQFIDWNLASLYHNLSLTRMFLLNKIKNFLIERDLCSFEGKCFCLLSSQIIACKAISINAFASRVEDCILYNPMILL